MTGLDDHISSSGHKLALKILTRRDQKLSTREVRLQEMAEEFGWQYENAPEEGIEYFQTFYFFKSRPFESKTNCISHKKQNITWEISDVTFDEGALVALEEYHTTLGLIRLPFTIPKFTIEKLSILGKYLDLSAHKDIDYVIYPHFSSSFNVKVEDIDAMDKFLSEDLKLFIEESNIHHLESNGEAILIFNDNLRLAKVGEYTRLVSFTEKLSDLVNKSSKS